MVKVWILVFQVFLTGAYGPGAGGPAVVDNLATKTECERVARNLQFLNRKHYEFESMCIEAWKVKAEK